jgi:glycosyltransferase involved in cell wall biosynthesis
MVSRSERSLSALEIFPNFYQVHFTKEVGLLAHHLAGERTTILARRTGVLRRPAKFLPRVQVLKRPFFLHALCSVWRRAPQTDVLVMFHSHWLNPLYTFAFRMRNPRGFAYAKADMDESILSLRSWSFLNAARRIKIGANLATLDAFSIEQERIYTFLRAEYPRFREKMMHLPSGYGDFDAPARVSFSKKKNVMLVVGAIGRPQKATDIILRALDGCGSELQDWKVVLVGEVEHGFKGEIRAFFSRNPALSDKVIVHGPSKSRRELLRLYRDAKILLMPSRYEGFSNVPAEAAHFGVVIIGTPVGGVLELTDNGRIGALVPIEDVRALRAAIKRFVSNQELLALHSRRSADLCDKKYSWSEIALRLRKRILDARAFCDTK